MGSLKLHFGAPRGPHLATLGGVTYTVVNGASVYLSERHIGILRRITNAACCDLHDRNEIPSHDVYWLQGDKGSILCSSSRSCIEQTLTELRS